VQSHWDGDWLNVTANIYMVEWVWMDCRIRGL
jgi:hypothetical protein